MSQVVLEFGQEAMFELEVLRVVYPQLKLGIVFAEEFGRYFQEEMGAIGDDTLSQELEILDKLIIY
ncbi:hypothetical protein ACFLU4_01765 [Chloroflexota bacterium]